mmetsp:Transcript_17783/g.41436  ORF Transcript_17783/g.41436 Transcript_17783/m.41436 type:complete len:456 (+) Transcript_17783:85-1452(+)|eukprot:CAMPEP_0178448188 /NCGR_PEP_ID=MMETSP0689_2-20121128/41837_1 /TAXON_ID=160604 /ORGANISM="Amphidinium massartii, Strain CS-259" /LENGTH=455 /DNA_ID=CAMNT_0020073329 /DNA_START=1 /DNA_END=1368 /DNA_ORIENTATION=-
MVPIHSAGHLDPFEEERQLYDQLQVEGKETINELSRSAFSISDLPGYIRDIRTITRDPVMPVDSPASTGQTLAAELVKRINNGKKPPASAALLSGHLVPEGYIQFIHISGRIEAVGSGRWTLGRLGLSRARWGKHAQLTSPLIRYQNVTIVWVKRGQLGLAWEAGAEVLLDAGLHVYNSPAFNLERIVDQNIDYLEHGVVHIIRVPAGKLAKVWCLSPLGGHVPRLLSEGVHGIESSFFRYEGLVSMMERHITHGGAGTAIHVLKVPVGSLLKVLVEGKPLLLGAGYHMYEAISVHTVGLAMLSEKCIRHGHMHLIRVLGGEVAVAWLNNEPLLIDVPGNYGFRDGDFKYVRHQPLADKVIQLGAKKVVTVHRDEICMSHQHGALKILEPGRHVLDDPMHTIDGFMATDQATTGPVVRLLLNRSGRSAWFGACCSGTPQTIGHGYPGEEKWSQIH